MPRHLPKDSVKSVLLRGAPVEQFLKRTFKEGDRRVTWLEIRPIALDAFEVRRFDVEDRGGANWADVYAWIDEDTVPTLSVFPTPEQAIEFAANESGALPHRWVNLGCVQDEYLDDINAVSVE